MDEASTETETTIPGEAPKEKTLSSTALVKKEARERFLRRREFVERSFLNRPPQIRQVTTLTGGEIKVICQTCVLPENLKSSSENDPNRRLRLTIYVPGMARLDPPNLGNVPEIHLASGILTGDTDAIIMVKPEGINDKAYTATKGLPQKDTSRAALEGVLEQVDKLLGANSQREVDLRIAGLSEGSTIAPSLVARLLESDRQNVHVQELVSVCAGGLSGPSKLSLNGLIGHLKRTISTMAASRAYYERTINDNYPHLNQYSLKLGDNERFIDGRVFGIRSGEAPDGLEEALGVRTQDLKLDNANFNAVLIDAVATQLGIPKEVPITRLEAAFAENGDWKAVAAAGITTIIISSTRDIFFSNQDTRSSVRELRKRYPDWHPIVVGTNIEHKKYHEFSQAVAGIIRFIEDSARTTEGQRPSLSLPKET